MRSMDHAPRAIVATVAAVLAALAATSAAAAASDYYLKFDTIKGGSAAARASGGKPLEIESWSWGTTMAGDWDGTIKGPPDGAAQAGAAKYGAVSGLHRDDSIAAKRQHGWITVSQPLDRGSVRVKVKFPWLECRVGAAFPDAVLQNAAGRYELEQVLVAGCAPNGVALNYAKVKVRGWDPATKQE